jgi:hypothetical protein
MTAWNIRPWYQPAWTLLQLIEHRERREADLHWMGRR